MVYAKVFIVGVKDASLLAPGAGGKHGLVLWLTVQQDRTCVATSVTHALDVTACAPYLIVNLACERVDLSPDAKPLLVTLLCAPASAKTDKARLRKATRLAATTLDPDSLMTELGYVRENAVAMQRVAVASGDPGDGDWATPLLIVHSTVLPSDGSHPFATRRHAVNQGRLKLRERGTLSVSASTSSAGEPDVGGDELEARLSYKASSSHGYDAVVDDSGDEGDDASAYVQHGPALDRLSYEARREVMYGRPAVGDESLFEVEGRGDADCAPSDKGDNSGDDDDGDEGSGEFLHAHEDVASSAYDPVTGDEEEDGVAYVDAYNDGYAEHNDDDAAVGADAQPSSEDAPGAEVTFDLNQRYQAAMVDFGVCVDGVGAVTDAVVIPVVDCGLDFINMATLYGKIIISERFLPREQKTIKPALGMGGIAGGDKYIASGILFKVCVNEHGLYANDHYAAKVAGHELKGLIMLREAAGRLGLRQPVTALLDYRGFRLMAICLLPIRFSESLVYGSADAGKTVVASRSVANRMKRLGRSLNVAPFNSLSGTPMALCTDIEVHRAVGQEGSDTDTFYLIDAARIMPPEVPKRSIRGSHLARLLRPEFVRKWHKPLCCDAFTGFLRHDSRAKAFASDVKEATQAIYSDFVPKAVDVLIPLVSRVGIQTSLSRFMHASGLNMRHMGAVASHLHQRIEYGPILRFVLAEMVARVVKCDVRSAMREAAQAHKVALEAPYRKVVIQRLNLALGHGVATEQHWCTVLAPLMKELFFPTLPELSQDLHASCEPYESALRSLLLNGGPLQLVPGETVLVQVYIMHRLEQQLGVKRSAQHVQDEDDPLAWRTRAPLAPLDIDSLGFRLKDNQIVTLAHSVANYVRGLRSFGYSIAHLARPSFKRASMLAEGITAMLINCEALTMMARCDAIASFSNEGIVLNSAGYPTNHSLECLLTARQPSIQRAFSELQLFRSHLGVVEELLHAPTLLTLGFLAHYMGAHMLAEHAYLLALELDVTNRLALSRYSEFLRRTEQS